MGIDFAARLSGELGILEMAGVERIRKLIEDWGYEKSPAKIDKEKILAALRHDKKSSGGMPRWVLIEKIGRARFGCPVKEEKIDALL